MAQAVDEALVPVLRRNYTADSYLIDILKEAIRQAAENFQGQIFQRQAERLSQRVVSRAESDSTEAFVEQINRAIGIDMTALMVNENLVDYVDASIESNVALIKSLSSDYFEDIQMQVYDGILRGDSLTTIVRNLQHVTGATYNRAHLIARDQTAKIQSDITSARQQNAGIDRFRWSTSQDVRVSGNPAGNTPTLKFRVLLSPEWTPDSALAFTSGLKGRPTKARPDYSPVGLTSVAAAMPLLKSKVSTTNRKNYADHCS